MRPWQHARSSAGKDGDWRRDLPIHEFMDSTKTACPDLRHRMILHNADLGPHLAARAFPGRADARAVALLHVREDLGCTPSLADWLDGCDLDALPRPLERRLPINSPMLASQLARAQHAQDDAGPRAVLDLLLFPTTVAGLRALPVLLNGFGPALARAVLGAPWEVPAIHGGRAVFDAAYAAEAIIHWVFGTIPPLVDVAWAVRHIPAAGRERR